MTTGATKVWRAAASVPFLAIAVWCARAMDIRKIVEYQQPFVDSGVIAWEGGRRRVAILDHFHGVDLLDQKIWRGTMATFAPSTFGFDSVAAWQMFSFLTDLGPVYAVWVLESYRPAHAYTPAYFPTFFSLAGQLLGLGPVAPIFYFLCFAFGPSAADLARAPAADRTVPPRISGLLLPIVVLFHTAQVFAMFLAPDLETRHFWTWAWQLAPFWIGTTQFVLTKLFAAVRPSTRAAPATATAKPAVFNLPLQRLCIALGGISAAVWAYTVAFAPHALPTLFLPRAEAQTEFVAHSRNALQADGLAVFSSSLLWLVYAAVDLQAAGLLAGSWLYPVLLLLVVAVSTGPGAAFVLGWYWREKALSAPAAAAAGGSSKKDH